jgi:hypothetical protein
LHIHSIRKTFHKQLAELWRTHPVLLKRAAQTPDWLQHFAHDGFNWRPLVTERNGLICRLDILLLRHGPPGEVIYDIDNRVKTVFDALRKARSPDELGAGTPQGQQTPAPDEHPFFVLAEDDRLITHVAVTSDMLLEPVPDVPQSEAARLIVGVTIRPYDTHMDNLAFA